MEIINIIGLFIEDHERIVSLLNDFKKHKHDKKKKTVDIFKQLVDSIFTSAGYIHHLSGRRVCRFRSKYVGINNIFYISKISTLLAISENLGSAVVKQS